MTKGGKASIGWSSVLLIMGIPKITRNVTSVSHAFMVIIL